MTTVMSDRHNGVSTCIQCQCSLLFNQTHFAKRKLQDLQSTRAASDDTDADGVEVPAATASTSFQKGEEIWDMQDMASTQNKQNEAKLLFSWPLSSPLLTSEFKFNSLSATVD